MEETRVNIIKSILRFLRDEIEHSRLDAEQKESLDVARQCLESTYEIDGNDRSSLADASDLHNLFKANVVVTEDDIKRAEDSKTRGNEQMKLGHYSEGVEYYTKAIRLNPKNHVYYCNRAAGYSRLGKHWDAISDCKESIKITATAKAYGRMGVAYSNMNMYKEAKEAYAKARELDPSNATYELNLKLAEEYLSSGSGSRPTAAAAPPSFPAAASSLDFNSFMNNPALLNMASQMLNDPAFRNMVSGIMSTGPNGDPNIDAFVTVGQQLAQQMQAANPNLMDTLRANIPGNRGNEDNEDPPNPSNQ